VPTEGFEQVVYAGLANAGLARSGEVALAVTLRREPRDSARLKKRSYFDQECTIRLAAKDLARAA